MDELARKLSSLRREVVPAWSDTRCERLYTGATKLQRRRRMRRIVLYSVGPIAAIAALGLGIPALLPAYQTARLLGINVLHRATAPKDANVDPSRTKPESNSIPVPLPSADALRGGARMKLADGSRVEVSSSGGELLVRRNERDDVDLRLAAGGAHFDVVPSTQRRFSVVAGSVEVSVLGTIFDVERVQGWVRVSVSRGKVRVRSAAGVALVEAGGSNWFEETDERFSSQSAARFGAAPVGTRSVGETGARMTASADETDAARVRGKPRGERASGQTAQQGAARVDWRSLSQSGDYEGAYELLAQGSPVGNDSEALMEAADAARLTNHPEAAASYLRMVLQNRRGPITPLAAFTLGRVLLERLGRPSEAAEAFARARELAPEDSLAQDSLAREVEAWSKAGHSDRAYKRARLYAARYPGGRRLRAVQLYGGLLGP